MANQPIVYSQHDRHQLLMALGRAVSEHVNNNPDPYTYHDAEQEPLPIPHSVTSGK